MFDTAKAIAYNSKRHQDKHFEALNHWGWLDPAVAAASPGSAAEAAAVAAWQKGLGIGIDGCCGPGTWAAARKLAWPEQTAIPTGRAETDAIYGVPGFRAFPNPKTRLDQGRLTVTKAWQAANIVQARVAGHTFPCHKLAKSELERIAERAADVSGYKPHCDGVFVPRRRNWSADPKEAPSNHSWGAAVDFNAQQNARGRTDTEMRKFRLFPAMFEVAGWVWGGTFETPDDMHMQRGRGF